MAALPQHAYECQCKGHEGGSRTFLDAPPEWYQGKGISTPKNCKVCRAWIKAQTDEMRTCACGSKIRISERAKISHFKRVGPYVPITECRPCREGNKPPKGIKKRPDRKKKEEQKKEKPKRSFQNLAHGISAEVRPVPYDEGFYSEISNNKKVHLPNVDFWAEERWEHLMHHVPGSEYDWTHPSAKAELGLEGETSPTSFVGFNASFEELMESASTQLQQTSNEHVREYQLEPEKGKAKIARVTFSGDHDNLELTILKETSGGNYGIITTYDNLTVDEVVKNKWYTGKKD